MAEPRNQGVGEIPRIQSGSLGVANIQPRMPVMDEPTDIGGAIARVLGGAANTLGGMADRRERKDAQAERDAEKLRHQILVAERNDVAGMLADFDYGSVKPQGAETLEQATDRTLAGIPRYTALQPETQEDIRSTVLGGVARLREKQGKELLYQQGIEAQNNTGLMFRDPQQRAWAIKNWDTLEAQARAAGIQDPLAPLKSAALSALATGDVQLAKDLQPLMLAKGLGDDADRAIKGAEATRETLIKREIEAAEDQYKAYEAGFEESLYAEKVKLRTSNTDPKAYLDWVTQTAIPRVTSSNLRGKAKDDLVTKLLASTASRQGADVDRISTLWKQIREAGPGADFQGLKASVHALSLEGSFGPNPNYESTDSRAMLTAIDRAEKGVVKTYITPFREAFEKKANTMTSAADSYEGVAKPKFANAEDVKYLFNRAVDQLQTDHPDWTDDQLIPAIKAKAAQFEALLGDTAKTDAMLKQARPAAASQPARPPQPAGHPNAVWDAQSGMWIEYREGRKIGLRIR